MGDRTSTSIVITGEIATIDVLEGLIDAAEHEGVSTDWGTGCAEPDALRAAIKAAIEGKTSLSLYDDQCNYGTFDVLESFCKKAGLSYTRSNDEGDNYDAESVSWTPGMESHASVLVDGGDAPLIPIDPLERLLKLPPDAIGDGLRALLKEAKFAAGMEGLPEFLGASADVLAALEEEEE